MDEELKLIHQLRDFLDKKLIIECHYPRSGKTLMKAEEWAKSILTLIKQNYVKLAKDQSLPADPYDYTDECRESTAYSEGQQDMLKANFQRIEDL